MLEAVAVSWPAPAQVDALLVDYRTGTVQDAETPSWLRCLPTVPWRKWTPVGRLLDGKRAGHTD